MESKSLSPVDIWWDRQAQWHREGRKTGGSSRPSWLTQWCPGQHELHDTISNNKQKGRRIQSWGQLQIHYWIKRGCFGIINREGVVLWRENPCPCLCMPVLVLSLQNMGKNGMWNACTTVFLGNCLICLGPVPLFTISTHYIPDYKPSLWLPHAYLENDRVLVNEERPTPF